MFIPATHLFRQGFAVDDQHLGCDTQAVGQPVIGISHPELVKLHTTKLPLPWPHDPSRIEKLTEKRMELADWCLHPISQPT